MTKRIFVSIDLPAKVRAYLKNLQKPDIYWIKWMRLENLHITLNFLGELDGDELERAKTILQNTVSQFGPFPLVIDEVKPERDMLWLVPKTEQRLFDLQSELLQNFRAARMGKREKRHYVPHILLAKSKTGRRMTWRPESFEPQEFLVDKINLYESRLTPGSATHILIESFALPPTSPLPHEGEVGRGS